MSMKVLTTTLAAFACAAVVAAQAPPPPQVPAAPPPSPAPAPSQRAPETKSTPASGSLTVTGCVERKAEGSSATPGAVGTAGGAGGSGFILTKVTKPTGTAGSSSAGPVASSYRLEADDSKLSTHVGHKVEIMGTLDRSASSAGKDSDAPMLKVDNVKMIAASCTE